MDDEGGNVIFPGNLQNFCIWLVRDDEAHAYFWVLLEVLNNFPCITSRSGSENGDVFHFLKNWIKKKGNVQLQTTFWYLKRQI